LSAAARRGWAVRPPAAAQAKQTEAATSATAEPATTVYWTCWIEYEQRSDVADRRAKVGGVIDHAADEERDVGGGLQAQPSRPEIWRHMRRKTRAR